MGTNSSTRLHLSSNGTLRFVASSCTSGSCGQTPPRAENGQANIALRRPQARQHAAEPTPRQRDLIQLLAVGGTMKEAASILNITTRTVASHKYGVMGLLQLRTTADLVQYAVKHNIISI